MARNQACFEAGILIRNSGDTLMLSAPFIITDEQIAYLVATLTNVLGTIEETVFCDRIPA